MKDIEGILKEGTGEEYSQTKEDDFKYGIYEIVLLDKDEIKEANIKPDAVKNKIIKEYDNIVKSK